MPTLGIDRNKRYKLGTILILFTYIYRRDWKERSLERNMGRAEREKGKEVMGKKRERKQFEQITHQMLCLCDT